MISRPGSVNKALAAALLLGCALAHADEAPRGEDVIAEALFAEAKRLMTERRYSEACPKLAESQRIDPGGGTSLLLALCLERQGKLASAWSTFTAALALAERDRRPERAATAREHLASLEPRLSFLTVRVAPELARLDGLRVLLDGVALASPAWGVALPADAGEHEVRAEAPGRAPASRRIRLPDEPQRQTVSLSLADLIPLGDPGPSSSFALVPAPAPAPRPRPSAPAAPVLLAGAGAAALVSAGVLLLSARRDVAQIDALCPSARCPDPRARDLNDTARAKADAAAVAAGVGGLLLGGAAALALWGPRRGSPALAVGPRETRLGWAWAW